MKGDFSRRTYDRRKHHSAVLSEQGRLLTDADLGEEHGILSGLHEQVAADVIGESGGPIDRAGFGITVTGAGAVKISAGRYYVDGILAEAEADVAYKDQPHPPALPGKPLPKDGDYPVVLDVWRRLVTALDDPSLRDVALGGPTTASREQTVWQVRILDAVPNWTCADVPPAIAVTTGSMAARATPEATEKTPCLVPPLAGYSGIENQFYRVETLRAGEAKKVAAATPVTVSADTTDQIDVGAAAPPAVGDLVELVRTGAGADALESSFTQVIKVDGAVVTVATPVPALAQGESLGLRVPGPVAVFSRENGSVAAGIESIDATTIQVTDLGPDDVLGFAPRQWVEVSDDLVEFDPTKPRALYFITAIDKDASTVTLATPVTPLSGGPDGADPSRHPKLRRWDGAHGIWFDSAPGGWLHLENGIEVAFAKGDYVRDDHWWFPARTAVIDATSGNIEWPQDAGAPASLPPTGIARHRAALARISVQNGKATVSDCRNLFPPLTELTSLLYVGGDGQEARRHDAGFPTLPSPLEVRVANGEVPVAGARVRFTPDGGPPFDVTTDPDGIANFTWKLDAPATAASPAPPAQQVCTAHLLDAAPAVIPNQIVRFTATVQDLTTLLYVGGDGQETRPGDQDFPRLQAPLSVRVASGAHPVKGATVAFTAVHGNVSPATVTTGADGVASTAWKLDSGIVDTQTATATLAEADGSASGHQTVVFSARLYPESGGGGGGCCVSIGRGGDFATIEKALKALRERGEPDVCLCLLPGDHEVRSAVVEGEVHLSIRGSGRASRVAVADRFDFHGLASLRLADFDLRYPDYRQEDRPEQGILFVDGTPDVAIDGVHVFGRSGSAALVTIRGALRARVAESVLEVPSTRNLAAVAGMFEGLRVMARNNARLFPPLRGIVADLETAFATIDDPLFERRTASLMEAIASLSDAARRRLAAPMGDWLAPASRGPLTGPVERLAKVIVEGGDLRQLPSVITAVARLLPTAADFTSGLVGLEVGPEGGRFDASSAPSEITVHGTTVYGDASFHGPAARTTKLLTKLNRDLLQSAAQGQAFAGRRGTVHFSGNHLGRLRVSEETIERLVAFTDAQGGVNLDVHRSFVVSDNVFDAVDTPMPLDAVVVARHVALNGNHFTRAGATGEDNNGRVLHVLAAAVAVTGNMGEVLNDRLAAIELWSPRASEAGNVDLVFQ